jgi:hypothetical protein
MGNMHDWALGCDWNGMGWDGTGRDEWGDIYTGSVVRVQAMLLIQGLIVLYTYVIVYMRMGISASFVS